MDDASGVSLLALRDALLVEVETEAEQLVSSAAERAAAQVAQAEGEVADLVRHARGEGEAAAEREAAAELTHARRSARTLVLEAQRSVYEDVRREAHAAAQRLRSEPGYDELVEHLATHAREVLGPDVELELDPPGGGVIARSGRRRLVLTLPTLVERCLAAGQKDLERLWA